jgi:bleomycin hydrolase
LYFHPLKNSFMKKIGLLSFALFVCSNISISQNVRNDKGQFETPSNPFYQEIKKANTIFLEEKKETPKSFKMDFSGIDIPKSAKEFTSVWAGESVSQGETGTCWCFSTTSFYESEIYRLTKQEIRLSELFTVYWQYVEKAREFVHTRGKSEFGEGSETNAVQEMMKKYGVVPYSAYNGLKPGQKFHDHSKMYPEMFNYLQSVKTNNEWNEEAVLSTIKSILNFYIGEPPATVTVNGKKITPVEYLKTVTKLNPDDYISFMSLMEKPYWTKAEYTVSDNWWHSADYYNVPLNDFMSVIKSAIKNGYSMSIGGDVSESGINSQLGVAMVPTYDIPSANIDENSRQFRFSNQSTTDDHALHLVGYLEKPNGTWFLIKDSGSGGHNNQNSPGYYYYHEDFVKLKMMTFTIHKDAAKEILQKFAAK